jgi:hypothetical protein
MKRPIVITLLVLALALVCAGIGSVIFFTVQGEFPAMNPFDVLKYQATMEESKTLAVETDKPLRLKVTDDAGDVTVTGAEVDRVEVRAVKTAYGSSQARADEALKSVKYTIEQSGNTVTINYELPESLNLSNRVNTVDFFVTVPTETTVSEVNVADTKGNVDVKNDFGNVTIENMEGALTVLTNSGEVTATSIAAGSDNIDLRSDFGGVTLKKAGGRDISLDSNSGTLTLSEVRAAGSLITNTDFGGTKVENGSADALHIETNSGEVSVVKVKVNREIFVKDDFGGIELEQALAASYDLHTNSGSITVDGAKGKLKADTDFGNITIRNAQSVTLTVETNSGSVDFSGSLGVGPHLVKSDFGGIALSLPPDTKLTVDLKTDFGTIKSDLPITIVVNGRSSNPDSDHIEGDINGGGGQLTVQANSGNINLTINK